MTVFAFVRDLMDRSRIASAVPDVRFVTSVDDLADATAVVVDLAAFGAVIAPVRAVCDARIVAFGAHVDEAAFRRATDDGADRVLPRSRFFHDVASALGEDA